MPYALMMTTLLRNLIAPGVNLDDPLFIKIFGNPQNGDFTHGTDPLTGDQATASADQIEPTILNLSFNQLAASVPNVGTGGGASAPLPSGAVAGALLAGLLLSGFVMSKRQRLAVA